MFTDSETEFNLFQFLVSKNNSNKYMYTIAKLLKLFPDMSKYLIEKARMHTMEAGTYVKERLKYAMEKSLF